MRLRRAWRHLLANELQLKRAFPESTLASIERAIEESEIGHCGEICFAVEAALPVSSVLANKSARERAIEVFAQLRVWDTEENSGVLIYLLFADHDVEIVADRGIDARVEHAEWEAICARIESAFRAGQFEEGVIAAVHAVGELLAQHFPSGRERDELSDRPVIL
jgi:uncharacterized membrane protein